MLIAAITKGADQLFKSSSKIGAIPEGCFTPVNEPVKAKGLVNTLIKSGFLAAAFMVKRKLSKVPPEKVPFITRTRPLTRERGRANFSLAAC